MEPTKYCTFTNDNNCIIFLPNINNKYREFDYCDIFSKRDNHEVIFRKINTILINNKIIKGNIIDLGAWIGDNSIPWSKNIDGIVYAIDPSEYNCNFIKEVIKINDIKNMIVLKEVISDKIKVVSTDDDLWHASFQSNENGTNKTVSTSLDTLYENGVLEKIDYIHIDVEGMERLVIIGAQKIIDENQPIISFEQHISWEDYTGLSNYIKSKNYRVFLIDEILPGCMPDCRNLIAFPQRLDSNKIKKIIEDSIQIDNILIEI
jgi:FkbM family methyltransferase